MKLKDKKIQILQQTTIKDKDGFTTKVWTPIHEGSLWAYFRQLSGKEIYVNATTVANEDVVFVVNWRGDITTAMLVKFKGKAYNITRIDVFEGYKGDISLYCKVSGEKL